MPRVQRHIYQQNKTPSEIKRIGRHLSTAHIGGVEVKKRVGEEDEYATAKALKQEANIKKKE